MNKLKINYDPKADALYIKLSYNKIKESAESGNQLIIDYDEKGEPVGTELLNASCLFGGKKEISVELSLTEAIKT